MNILFLLLILISIVTVSYLLAQLPLASSDSGSLTGFETRSPDLSNMSLVLYDTFQQTSLNSTKDLHLEFFDMKNKTLIKNTSFFINFTKDDNILMHELFYTRTGSMTLQFSPGSEMGKWVINGTAEPVLGGMMSDNDVLPIQISAFTPGIYHIHLEVLALVYNNGIVDQSHPPTFDSWWSVDDRGNISKYENSTTSVETLSHVIKNMSPLQQVKSGATASDIVCSTGSYLAMTSYNRELVCLKAGTISKLASRGFLYGTSMENTNYATIIISPESENQASHNSYSPDVAKVVLGINNTVRWVNQADTANTIVPDMPLVQNGKSFGSDGVVKPGQSYQFTFTAPGTIPYHTEPHPWMKGTIIVLSNADTQSTQQQKMVNPLGVTALVTYSPPDACLGLHCPSYTFYLKINANSTAYLLGYDICGNDLCVKNNTLSILLPINNMQAANYTVIGLSDNKKWNYGDTVHIKLEVSSSQDNKTAYFLDIKNSSIVP